MNTRVIPAIGLNLARRCKSVLLAQLYYAERELLLCCGVLSAFLGFFAEIYPKTTLKQKARVDLVRRTECHRYFNV